MNRVPVSPRALVARIKKHLTQSGRVLLGGRGRGAHYYVIDGGKVERARVDLEAYGRELGVLAEYEELTIRNPGSDSAPAEERSCTRCRGCGRIADSESGEPWIDWEEIPFPSDLAVRAGIVKPVACPKCGGTGTEA